MNQILKIRVGDDARTPRYTRRASQRIFRQPRNAIAYAAALEVLG